MNPKIRFTLITAIVSLMISVVSCTQRKEIISSSDFKTPPDKVKLHTWLHWLDGNITKEGLTKDLEAMKEQGIAQATILNIGLFGEKDFGVKRITFNTPEWFEMFEWALKEANRLGIAIGAHNCDGWSTSGGPWITPEMSMKQFTWTKTMVSASQSPGLKLKKPMAVRNYFKDVAVIAIKNKDAAINSAPARVTLNDSITAEYLNDGCPASAYTLVKGNRINFGYETPKKADRLTILPRRSFMWGDPGQYLSKYSLFASSDGKTFRKVHEFSIKGLNKAVTIPLPQTTAQHFRLVLDETNNIDAWIPFTIGECEILAPGEKPVYAPEIENISEKTGEIKAAAESLFYTKAGNNASPKKEVIDLTAKMNGDGTLNWTPGEGTWTVIRFGYTSTGATNGPATAAGTGLECDKMDTAALNLHFRSFPLKMIQKAGSFAGNTFKFMLVDSWECGFQNWTAALPNEFEKRRGYSLLPYIPVLCGESSGSSETDDAVLYDFRRTIADLIENNYYKHFSDLLHENKMEFHSEVIYGNANYPALDILKTTKYVDLPMYEFWSTTDNNLNLTYYPVSGVELNMPACAAIGYQKPVMASEAYTGMAHYCESPAGLKPFGDRAYCAGINQMILHSYVHQPNDKVPGMTLGQFGSHFNRNNSYWQYISGWFNFQERINYVLQQGVASHDVLYYLGDQLPQYLVYNQSNKLPFGYMFNSCNFDILKNRIKVSNGKLVLNNEVSYSLLSFPPYETMSFETLKHLEALIKQGAVVYAPKPKFLLSLNDINNNRKEFEELTAKIWGNIDGKQITENTYGKGKVFWGIPISMVLEKMQILPDIKTGQSDSTNLLFIHKKTGDTDVYFVANQQNKTLKREISFRITGKTPEIWNPEYGTITQPAIFSIDKNYTTLPVTLKPYESLLFVFRNTKPGIYIHTVRQNGEVTFPAKTNDSLKSLPEITVKQGKLFASSAEAGNIELTTSSNKTLTFKGKPVEVIEINEFTGKIHFGSSFPGTPEPIEINRLSSFSDSENPKIRYFSGKASYSISFKIEENKIQNTDSILLDIGNFESIAEVKLNGKILERLWRPGKLIPVKSILKPENILEISIATIYRNRFVGDFIEYGKVQNLWTSSPIGDFLNKDRPLQPSGLMGPIRIFILSPQEIR